MLWMHWVLLARPLAMDPVDPVGAMETVDVLGTSDAMLMLVLGMFLVWMTFLGGHMDSSWWPDGPSSAADGNYLLAGG